MSIEGGFLEEVPDSLPPDAEEEFDRTDAKKRREIQDRYNTYRTPQEVFDNLDKAGREEFQKEFGSYRDFKKPIEITYRNDNPQRGEKRMELVAKVFGIQNQWNYFVEKIDRLRAEKDELEEGVKKSWIKKLLRINRTKEEERKIVINTAISKIEENLLCLEEELESLGINPLTRGEDNKFLKYNEKNNTSS
ncbi:MAG: hypothetical protein COU06_02390 [Candidatus Harrisonbacteria bacterium CG10_big_fil_rev_8_21_14_0_10_38_8]|uniref:Uncharacterized protein n=1 Tax=Candidatus Harrisonbacteria bacterium CG10_big_fil_rev_8_21_14_0_10_38_8 TaxID=1974582 RepID=A0A2M6WJM5_9BACT|nr:MAG: hypothetical protein COU06_02390 [Candidatus Harrisonbacteria bacterium CG10_big_fil_rev_8_21_14_0_10_38_8]